MLVTELGILTIVNPVQFLNAEGPIAVTVVGIVVLRQPKINVLVEVLIIALQLFLLSYTEFPEATVIEVKFPQSQKAYEPIVVTELGMVIVDRLQFINAYVPILVIELESVIDDKLWQSRNAPSPIKIREFGNCTEVNPKDCSKA